MSRSAIAVLRDFVPIRPLRRAEALRIAELQATRFLKLSMVAAPPVPERIIAELPRVQIERVNGLPVSGATHWTKGRWLILLRAQEAPTRQLFSTAHELKHILDDRFVDVLYQGVPDDQRAQFIEQVCDYFAGCLLIPRPWLKHAWAALRIQRLPDLARHFGVSEQAVEVRLSQTGLGPRRSRCGREASDWSLPSQPTAGSSAVYHRLAPVLIS
ncbi:MAG TPA: ImmA/IrrE family metallo-endopeptidase [Acidimicrobiales bacterium]|nr:ImmA/IrrE family metallo-endopeptidase [Acidimicrobiales bacterium]